MKKKKKTKKQIIDALNEKEGGDSVCIDFMSHQGDFKLMVQGGDMNNCKGAFLELLGKVKKSVKPKKKEIRGNSYR